MWKTDAVLVLIGPLLSVWLLAILVRRKLYREFPFFFAYISAVILVSGIRFWAIHDYSIYFKVFWFSEALYAVMAVLALHEVFHTVFNEFYEIWPWFWLIFPAAVGIFAWLKISDGIHHAPAQAILPGAGNCYRSRPSPNC